MSRRKFRLLVVAMVALLVASGAYWLVGTVNGASPQPLVRAGSEDGTPCITPPGALFSTNCDGLAGQGSGGTAVQAEVNAVAPCTTPPGALFSTNCPAAVAQGAPAPTVQTGPAPQGDQNVPAPAIEAPEQGPCTTPPGALFSTNCPSN